MYKRQVTNADLTESIIISNAEAKSTPVAIKTNTKEKELSMNDLFNLISKHFDANDEKFDTKFDKLSNDINEQKIKCERSFNEIKNNFDEKFDKINNRFDTNESNFHEIRNEIMQVNRRFEKTNEKYESKFALFNF